MEEIVDLLRCRSVQLLDELGITYRVGHPATIRKVETRK
jgi:hypothetical protein